MIITFLLIPTIITMTKYIIVHKREQPNAYKPPGGTISFRSPNIRCLSHSTSLHIVTVTFGQSEVEPLRRNMNMKIYKNWYNKGDLLFSFCFDIIYLPQSHKFQGNNNHLVKAKGPRFNNRVFSYHTKKKYMEFYICSNTFSYFQYKYE